MVRLRDPEIACAVHGVLFDVDGTLYHQGCLRLIVGSHLALAAVLRPLQTVREMRILVHYRRAQEWLRLNRNAHITAESQLTRTVATTGMRRQEISDCIHFWMEQVPLRFLPFCTRRHVRRLINRWHGLAVPMGVYSDYPVSDRLRVLGLKSQLSIAVCSTDSEIGVFKPDPRGFKVAAAKMGLPPRNICYVGDRDDIDGVGAQNAGMHSLIIGKRLRDFHRGTDQAMTMDSLDSMLSQAHATNECNRCWICGSSSTRKFRHSTIQQEIDSRSVRITDSRYGQTAALSECRHCGFIFADPVPYPELINLFKDMDDNAYQASASARRIQMSRLLDSALAYHPQARSLLDVGAGTGLLVAEALARDLRADGVEPSRWCVETAAKANGVSLFCGTLEECSSRLDKYDLVMLIDIVEHTTDPLGMIRQAADRVSPRGLLLIVTPDIGSPVARLMGRRWWHHRIAHVCYFSRRSIRYALEQLGLESVAEGFAGWRFPAPYLCERLVRYMPFPPISTALRRFARSDWLTKYEINVNLRDSRTFIAKKKI